MTCIIGLEHDGAVYIGADSAKVLGQQVRETRLHKVFRRGKFLIGYTTSFRMGQILQHHLNVRKQEKGETDDAFMVCAFIEAVRECLKEQGFTKVENNVEEGGSFLVGYSGKLYGVWSDFQVNSTAGGLDAIGCGAGYALGAMMVLKHLSPRKRIKKALRVAAHFSSSACGPFRVLKL